MATNGNGKAGFSFAVNLSPLQFYITMGIIIAGTTSIGVKYNMLCTKVDAAFIEMDRRTTARDGQYAVLTESISDLTTTVQDMRDGMIAAGILKPNAMRPMGHPDNPPPQPNERLRGG